MALSSSRTIERLLRERARRGPITVGHRGASGSAPENTVASFQAGLAAGAEVIELDFQQAADGTLVCVHDDTLDRTTDSRRVLGREGIRPSDVRLADLRRLDAGSWFAPGFAGVRIPTLAEAIAAIVPAGVPMLERKGGTADATLDQLRAAGAIEQVLVQSFDWDYVERLRRQAPELTLGVLGDHDLTERDIERALALEATVVHWEWTTLRLTDLRRLHSAGFLVCVYTVDPELALHGAVTAGVDLITTNHPSRLRRLGG